MFCQTVSASNEKRDESLGKIPYVIPVPIENHAYHIEYAIRVRHSAAAKPTCGRRHKSPALRQSDILFRSGCGRKDAALHFYKMYSVCRHRNDIYLQMSGPPVPCQHSMPRLHQISCRNILSSPSHCPFSVISCCLLHVSSSIPACRPMPCRDVSFPILQYKVTTVTPVPPNWICSSATFSTPGIVLNSFCISSLRTPVPFP